MLGKSTRGRTGFPYVVSPEDVLLARERISGAVSVTPVLTCSSISRISSEATQLPIVLALKCELFQRSGSFKMRGASNAVMSLTPEKAANGVCTHSSGNHAQALALAAQTRGDCPAHIVMPSNSPAVKKEATQGYGATVITCEPTLAAREAVASEVATRTGATFVHPSEDPKVIAGQGTLALELLEQVDGALGPRLEGAPHLDVLVVPVGGGGLISGCALALQSWEHAPLLVGAEPAEADDAARSKTLGVLQGHLGGVAPLTIADGLKTTLGPNTWPIVRDLVDDIVTVTEDQIKTALRLVYERAKLAIEPSAAVGVAVVTSEAFGKVLREKLSPIRIAAAQLGSRPLRVGLVLCGGNSDYKG